METLQFFIDYGIKQKLADSYSSAKTQAEFDSFLQKVLDKAFEGSLSTRTRGSKDEVQVEFESLVTARLEQKAKAQGKKLPKKSDEAYKAMFAKVAEAWREELWAKAEARVAEAKALAEDEVNLDDLI